MIMRVIRRIVLKILDTFTSVLKRKHAMSQPRSSLWSAKKSPKSTIYFGINSSVLRIMSTTMVEILTRQRLPALPVAKAVLEPKKGIFTVISFHMFQHLNPGTCLSGTSLKTRTRRE